MEKSLAQMGFPFEMVRVRQETRTNFTISDRQGLTIKLNEIGAPLEAAGGLHRSANWWASTCRNRGG